MVAARSMLGCGVFTLALHLQGFLLYTPALERVFGSQTRTKQAYLGFSFLAM